MEPVTGNQGIKKKSPSERGTSSVPQEAVLYVRSSVGVGSSTDHEVDGGPPSEISTEAPKVKNYHPSRLAGSFHMLAIEADTCAHTCHSRVLEFQQKVG
jgi:hypothetical protein